MLVPTHLGFTLFLLANKLPAGFALAILGYQALEFLLASQQSVGRADLSEIPLK